MEIKKTKIKDVFIIDPSPKKDNRGYFTRVFAKEIFRKNGIFFNIVHINRSLTKQKGTIRGMHYQIKPREENKIIQCVEGKIFDVSVDLRRSSPTFGKWIGVELSAKNKRMLLVPKGCAHGFQTLETNSLVEYFVSEYYSPEKERGVSWDDQFFNIKWPIKKAILSKKDKNWPNFLR